MLLSPKPINRRQALKKSKAGSGRSRGGSSTKIYLLCCGKGFPLQLCLTGGQAGEAPQLFVLLAQQAGKPKVLVADRAYDSLQIRKLLREKKIRAQIPEKALHMGYKRRRKGKKPLLDQKIYKSRNVIERLFGKLKEMRRFSARFDKLKDSYLAFIQLACIRIYLKPYFSGTVLASRFAYRLIARPNQISPSPFLSIIVTQTDTTALPGQLKGNGSGSAPVSNLPLFG